MNIKDISALRDHARTYLGMLLGLNLLATIGASVMAGGSTLQLGVTSLIFGITGAIVLSKVVSSATHRAVFAVLLQGQVAVFVAAFAGHEWQIDAHMLFFGTLSILILLVDYRAILAGSAAVALHHVAMNFVLPAMVYPDGGDFGRTMMHAFILLLSTVALTIATRALTQMSADSDLERAKRTDMVDQLAASLGHVVGRGVDGDFSQRVDAEFEDAQLTQIVEDTNRLLTTVDAGLSEAVRVMGRVVEGDLTVQMEGDFAGSVADMRDNVNGTITVLQQVVSDIETSSLAVNDVSGSISTGSEKLADRATQQAASVEETAAAIQNLTDSVQANDASAKSMSNLVTKTVQEGEAGREITVTATQAMSKMSQSTHKISEIIAVMNEISFQTNLLALNASVEAARAGDAGKGFAVVAEEVRALALRSTDAAKGINDLIEQSRTDVERGVGLVDQLGTTLTQMLDSVSGVSQMAGEIAKNSSMQSAHISEINATVAGIDVNTQTTAETAEAYFMESKALQGHATQLDVALARFTGKSQSTLTVFAA